MTGLPAYDKTWVYPGYERPFFEVWGDRFEAIFVWFHPFFKVEGVDPVTSGNLVSQYMRDPIGEQAYRDAVAQPHAVGSDNLEPAVRPILDQGSTLVQSLDHPTGDLAGSPTFGLLSWSHAAEKSALPAPAPETVSLALLTSIGALGKEYARPDLASMLLTWCSNEGVFPPLEGAINQSMHSAMTALLERAGGEYWIHQGEFDSDPVRTADFRNPEEAGRVHTGGLYLPDPPILATVDWDSFFTLVGGPKKLLHAWVADCGLDGFFADQHTRHDWWLTPSQQVQ